MNRPDTVRTVRIAGPGALELTEVPRPVLGVGELRARVEACGICGSDGMFAGLGRIPATTPFGHEVVAEVVETGPGTDPQWQGRRAVLLPFGSCGTCVQCRQGEETRCTGGFGNYAAGFADEAVVQAAAVPDWCVVPDGVSSTAASLLEPLAVAVRAVHKSEVLREERSLPVQVAGAGPIGLLVAYVLLRFGFSRVTVVERNEGKTSLLRELLPGARILTSLPEEPVHCLFECAGAQPVLDHAVTQGVERGGRICLVAAYKAAPTLDALQFMARELTMIGSFSATLADAESASRILFAEADVLQSLVTDTVPLEDVQGAFDRLRAGGLLGKCVVRP
ncbi:zinc-dependent alcohol dehydrogenase [Brevibacterium salitolerans]|uniref:Zinc-dependent alcohol dehydrogenase family protein n=1 Tax=Brevibacterium salitolerans TaxID=1403566 RepID=A0ABN2WI05_9MICO